MPSFLRVLSITVSALHVSLTFLDDLAYHDLSLAIGDWAAPKSDLELKTSLQGLSRDLRNLSSNLSCPYRFIILDESRAHPDS
jgi:hypothetical protein